MVEIEGDSDGVDGDDQDQGSQQGFMQGVIHSRHSVEHFFCQKICRKEWTVPILAQEVYMSSQPNCLNDKSVYKKI